MQEWSVFTWNTQGNFTRTDKINVINSICPRGLRVIGCIQEGGVDKGGAHGHWFAYHGYGMGSFNERCTNYILVNSIYSRFTTVDSFTLVNCESGLIMGGGEAGRTTASIGIGNTLFVSWHSSATRSNEDTSFLIRSIDQNPAYSQKYNTVIIGGDFNASPTDIDTLIHAGTERTRSFWSYPYRYVFSSGSVTHPNSNKELDFFVVMSQTEWTDSGPLANFRGVEMKNVFPSDHNPVLMKVFC